MTRADALEMVDQLMTHPSISPFVRDALDNCRDYLRAGKPITETLIDSLMDLADEVAK